MRNRKKFKNLKQAANAKNKPVPPNGSVASESGPVATKPTFANTLRKAAATNLPNGKTRTNATSKVATGGKQTRVRSNGLVATKIPVTATSSGVTSNANDSPNNLKSNATSGKTTSTGNWQKVTGKKGSKQRNATSKAVSYTH